MITCIVTYEIDPAKAEAFETYARMWLHLIPRMGGTHQGYYMPHEGANDRAWALFSFPSLAAYEAYRERMWTDPECLAAYRHAEETRCIRRYDRTFARPVSEGASPAELGVVA
jgi:hypothetical protein